jgi:hypothetical protein
MMLSLPFTEAPSHGGGGNGHAASIIGYILLTIIALHRFHKMYDYYFGEGRERRLERMRKRNQKIAAKAIEKLKEAEEIMSLAETTKKMEEAIVESGSSLSEDGDTND